MSNWSLGLQNFFNTYQAILVSVLLLLQLAVLVVMGISSIKMNKVKKRYNSLLKGAEDANLEGVLLSVGDRLQNVETACQDLSSGLDKQRSLSEYHVQRWSLLRYKAFSNTGGDQSFSMAMLDGKGNGVVISSIYGRDESRVYAKSVQEGRSTYALSSEEEEAIKQALSNERSI